MWFYFALGSALTNSVATVARRTHGSLARPVELAWWSLLLGLPPSVLLVVFSHVPLWTSHDFLLPALASALLCTFGSILLFDAYKYGQASAVSPIGNLLPIGLLISSFVMFGTVPVVGGALGVVLVVAGVYYSSVSGKHKLGHPLKSITSNRGARAMLGCVLLWSVSTNLDKIAVRSASPAFLVFLILILELVLISMYLLVQKTNRTERVFRRWWRHLIIIALFTTLAVYFQTRAVALTGTSYVLAVKRLDVLLTIAFAGIFLGERHLLKRFTGSIVALIGVVIIYFFN